MAQKNVINMMAQSFAAISVIGILWALVGYSHAFGTDHSGVIGDISHVALRGVGESPSSFAPHIPVLLRGSCGRHGRVCVLGRDSVRSGLPRLPRLGGSGTAWRDEYGGVAAGVMLLVNVVAERA